jgi:hypothetical protein
MRSKDDPNSLESRELVAAALIEWFQTPAGKAYFAAHGIFREKFRLEAYTYPWCSPKFRNIPRRQMDVVLRMDWGRGDQRSGTGLREIFFTQ